MPSFPRPLQLIALSATVLLGGVSATQAAFLPPEMDVVSAGVGTDGETPDRRESPSDSPPDARPRSVALFLIGGAAAGSSTTMSVGTAPAAIASADVSVVGVSRIARSGREVECGDRIDGFFEEVLRPPRFWKFAGRFGS